MPGRQLRPDGYCPKRREAWEFFGNYYHGYPPEHREYQVAVGVDGQSVADLFAATMARNDVLSAEGLCVRYIWEHDFLDFERGAEGFAGKGLLSIVREHSTSWRLEGRSS